MTPFNLLHESWLPVRWRGGDPPSEVGLRDALLRAHDIEELATDNPLETIALNRLLAALAASVFPELAERKAWFQCWKEKRFDAGRCEAYFNNEDCAGRFDLLSPEKPFFGHSQTDAKEVSPVSRLLHAAASGNNAVLFSHDLDCVPQPLTLAQAARALVCTQAAALGGGVAQPFNLCHAPLVGGAYFWLRGFAGQAPSLFNALLLNLTPLPDVWGQSEGDKPAWEAEERPAPKKCEVGGIRELFTFQSRRIQLVLNNDRQVVGVRYNQGSKIEKLLFHDPYLAYVVGKEGPYPLRFNAARALWRDSTKYMMTLAKKGEGGHAPRTFEWLASHWRDLGLDKTDAFAADVFGMVNDQAKVELWRQERVVIHPDILMDVDRWQALHELIGEADNWAARLRKATQAFAARVRFNKGASIRLSDIERNDQEAFVKALATDGRFWPALGGQFDQFLSQVATFPHDRLGEVRKKWWGVARNAAVEALGSGLIAYEFSDSAWQAFAEAEVLLQNYSKRKGNSMSVPIIDDHIESFIGFLESQQGSKGRANLAEIRRAAMNESHQMYPILGEYLPENEEWPWRKYFSDNLEWPVNAYLLVATLYAIHIQSVPEEKGRRRIKPFDKDEKRHSFGASLRIFHQQLMRNRQAGEDEVKKSFGKRMANLLDANREDLLSQLKRTVQHLASAPQPVPVDYRQLLKDILHWNNKETRRQWARDYWQPAMTDADENDPVTASNVPADSKG